MRSGTNHSQSSSAVYNARRERRNHVLSGSDVNGTTVYKRAYGQRRPPLIPPNYSGNAFREDTAEELPPVSVGEADPPVEEELTKESTAPSVCASGEEHGESKTPKSVSPFSDLLRGGLGNEELLLLALIFITSQSGESDILPYLVILLFSK